MIENRCVHALYLGRVFNNFFYHFLDDLLLDFIDWGLVYLVSTGWLCLDWSRHCNGTQLLQFANLVPQLFDLDGVVLLGLLQVLTDDLALRFLFFLLFLALLHDSLHSSFVVLDGFLVLVQLAFQLFILLLEVVELVVEI